jgi:hypothetical protein
MNHRHALPTETASARNAAGRTRPARSGHHGVRRRICAWWRGTPLSSLLEFPAPTCAYVGAPLESFIRYNAERGEYGPGDIEAQIAERVAAAANFAPHTTETPTPERRTLLLRGEPLHDKGFVTLYSDVTEQRYIET